MKKPKTRTKFASPEEQQEHVLNCLCWRYAEKMALELALSEDDQEKQRPPLF